MGLKGLRVQTPDTCSRMFSCYLTYLDPGALDHVCRHLASSLHPVTWCPHVMFSMAAVCISPLRRPVRTMTQMQSTSGQQLLLIGSCQKQRCWKTLGHLETHYKLICLLFQTWTDGHIPEYSCQTLVCAGMYTRHAILRLYSQRGPH